MRGLVDTRPKNVLWKGLDWLRPYLHLRPASGKFWLDCVYLGVLLAIQNTVFAQLTGSTMLANLTGVWLVANAVLLPVLPSFALCLFGGFLLETYSTVPVGLYMTTYWVVAAVLFLVRDSLSWRHLSPWLASVVLAELWVIGFEALIMGVEFHYRFLDLEFYLFAVARLTCSAAMAIVAYRIWRQRMPLEGIP